MTKPKPKLQYCPADRLDIFEMHEQNRDFHEHHKLYASMKRVGFMWSSPLQCIQDGKKLRVIRGHHRLHYARRLKIGVWYVIDDSNLNLGELEGDDASRWNVRDFLVSQARGGNRDSEKVLSFQRKHHLTQGSAIALLGGEGAGSNNAVKKVKDENFHVASDLRHAEAVVDITDHCRACGVTHATQAAFVSAISSALRVPEFDADLFKHRVSRNPSLLETRTNRDAYLQVIEDTYNYCAKGKRFPLVFLAHEVGRQRQATFGGKRGLTNKSK